MRAISLDVHRFITRTPLIIAFLQILVTAHAFYRAHP
jgi:hypothetical protein